MLNYKLGWIPDTPDCRDSIYKTDSLYDFNKIPDFVDLSVHASPVEDQGSLGSCTAQALVGALELLDKKEDKSYTDLSRLFLYYNERAYINSKHYDSGACLRDGIKSLASHGVCREELWIYDIKKFTHRPSLTCYTEAKTRKIKHYQRLVNVKSMFETLSQGYPFVFGFGVYGNFNEVAYTGVARMPDRKKDILYGGHAVLAVGYDKPNLMFKIRNSWGTSWGKEGYFWMPAAYLMDTNLSDDFWTIRK
jgi:C1A family cysteine protease